MSSIEIRRDRVSAKAVSLMALLRRKPGHIDVREKPAFVAPDYFDPVAGRLFAVGA